jgi:uncharacterized protein (DUF1684 family)
VRLVVHVSGDVRSLRVRDPDGPLAKGFRGFSWFPIDLQYRVVGHFIRDAEPRQVSVLNTYGDVDEFTTAGVVEFALLGRTLRLRPFTTRPKRFYFVFKDASSGHETYGAARFLYADLADDGTVVLDFNQAYNPPCSFNPYTTCPIPLRENELPIKVLAARRTTPFTSRSAEAAPPEGDVGWWRESLLSEFLSLDTHGLLHVEQNRREVMAGDGTEHGAAECDALAEEGS